MKTIADEFISVLKSKIDAAKSGKKVQYDTAGVNLKSSVIVESFDYFINSGDDLKQVSKEDFIQFGMDNKFEPKRDDSKGFKMNIEDNKIVGYYESITK